MTSAEPLKLAPGENVVPSSAVLIAASVPVKVMVASLAPSPVVKARPAVLPRLSTPLVALSVTVTLPLPASGSAMENALPLALLNTSVPSSFTVCAAGTVLTGASLTAAMLRSNVSLAARLPSLAVTRTKSVPLKFTGGVPLNVRVPASKLSQPGSGSPFARLAV